MRMVGLSRSTNKPGIRWKFLARGSVLDFYVRMVVRHLQYDLSVAQKGFLQTTDVIHLVSLAG
jgi:hypothetical protein